MAEDRVIREAVEAAVASIPAMLHVRVVDGVVHLAGQVTRTAERTRAEKLAGEIEGVRAVVNDLVVEVPRSLSSESQALELDRLEQNELLESPEPDLNQPVGTTDPLQPEVDPDVPYFPPTDPVIEPAGRAEGGFRVLGGYSEGSMDQPLAAEPAPERLQHGDEQIAENVKLALKEDAATTDLDIHVHVRNGVVYLRGTVRYLQDVESAEEVASRAPGVREVREQLHLQ